MATAATWLEKREKLREIRKSRNDRCLSRSLEPAGIMDGMVQPVFASLRIASRRPLALAIRPWLTPGRLSMSRLICCRDKPAALRFEVYRCHNRPRGSGE